jgi:hypothetical protein
MCEPLISREKCLGCWMWYACIDTRSGTIYDIIERLHQGALDHETLILNEPVDNEVARHNAEAVREFTNMLVNVARAKKNEK